MSDISDFFGGGNSSGVGLFSTFPAKRTIKNRGIGPDGFLGDGDFIALPTTNALSVLEYRDNANAVVWSIDPTDIDASCDRWVTFNMDGVDDLLWMVAMDESLNVLFTATVNAAGTIVNVGNATVATVINQGQAWTGSNTNNSSAANMLRTVQGTGNFTIRAVNVEWVIDYTDGSLVSETTKVLYLAGSLLSTQGVYFNPSSRLALSTASNIDGPSQTLKLRVPTSADPDRMHQADLLAPLSLGLPSDANTNGSHTYVCLQWKGEVLIFNSTNFATGGIMLAWNPDVLQNSVDTLVENFGLSQ